METIKRKTLLYKSKVAYADYAINHVLGCAHGCKYPCYAYLLHKRFGNVKDYDDWRQPKIGENAMELLEKDLERIGAENIQDVHMCFTTDPFMYDYRIGEGFSEVEDLTLQILDRLWREGIFTTTLTKGEYPVYELFGTSNADRNSYGITVVSLNESFREKYEPFTAHVLQRIEALRRLHDKGLHTWVSMEPFPTPNIDPVELGSMKRLMDSISFVDKVVFGPWNYSKLPREYGALNEPLRSAKFYRDMAARTKQYCDEKNIEFYDKRELKATLPTDYS